MNMFVFFLVFPVKIEDMKMKVSGSSKSMRKSLAIVLALGQVSLFSMAPVFADNSVRLAGNPLFSIGGPMAASSDRAGKIQSNIDNALLASTNHGPSAVKISYVKGLPVISLGGYYISTVDNATAKTAGATPTLLAQKWANALKAALADQKSVQAYIAQLSGVSIDPEPVVASTESSPIYSPAPAFDSSNSQIASSAAPVDLSRSSAPVSWQANPSGSNPAYDWQSALPAHSYGQAPYTQNGYASQSMYQGRVSYVPAGMMIPVKLATGLSSEVAKPGDVVLAKTIQDITLANGVIPANSTLIGQISESADGSWLTRSGKLGIKFTTLRTPNGSETPISAHITGKVGKYSDSGTDVFKGENSGSKIKKTLVATAIGAGSGSALGLAVGAIAGGGRGVGTGAWSGAAIGAGVGAAQSLLTRKGSEVNMMQGEVINLQLDAPVTVAMN